MRFYFFLLFLVLFTQTSSAQVSLPGDTEARQELEARGISEEAFRTRMMEKGYDLDNIQPAQLPELESVVEATLNELEQNTAVINPSESVVDENTVERVDGKIVVQKDEIAESIEEEASIEEIISEVENEVIQTKLPSTTVYGQQIFRNQTLEVYRSADNIKPPNTYVLGPGDEIIVAVFGRSQAEFAFTINEEGFIKPTGGSRIYLKGLTLEKAKRLVQKRFSQYYSFTPEQFALTVNAARTITVNIFGEVEGYGSFTISAINTAFNALVAAGGPTNIGTVRKIKIIRGKEVKILDVYDFLFDPTVQYDFFLQNNDIIQVPVSEKVVDIMGAVKRPLRYELIEREDLVDLIRYAGGLDVNAYLKNIQVNRIVGGQRIIIDVDLEKIIAQNSGFALENGDVVQVRTIGARLENYAEIDGAVEYPGKYELKNGMRLSDLVTRGTLREDARTDNAFILRENTNSTVQLIKVNLVDLQIGSAADLVLQRRDKLVVYSQRTFTDAQSVTINGAVRRPATYGFNIDLRLADLVDQSGGLNPDATEFAYLTRTNPNNSDFLEYIRIDIQQAVADPSSAANIKLEPEDKILIMSKRVFSDEYQIRVSGSVRNPGSYQYAPSLNLNDVLTLAGGLELSAAANRIDIFRVVLNENEPTQTVVATVKVDKNLNIITGSEISLEPFDIVVVRNVPDFELQETIVLNGEVRYPGVYALIAKNEKLIDVIKRAGGLTSEAFPEGAQLYRTNEDIGVVLLELDQALKSSNSRFNYIMKDGDNITIPKSKDLVTINLKGTLAAELYPDKMLNRGQLSVAYVSGKKADWYLKKYAAGLDRTKRARKRLVTVELPNGHVEDATLLVFTPKVKKGSKINVGMKPKKAEKPEKEKGEKIDWNSVIKDAFAIAGGAATIILSILVATRNQNP